MIRINLKKVIYDRSYMRTSLSPNFRCVTDYLILTLTATFLVQVIFKFFRAEEYLLSFLEYHIVA